MMVSIVEGERVKKYNNNKQQGWREWREGRGRGRSGREGGGGKGERGERERDLNVLVTHLQSLRPLYNPDIYIYLHLCHERLG